MLTSIRGLSAATFSAGLLFAAAPAFASETDGADSAAVEETASISQELIDAAVVLDTANQDTLSLAPAIARANAPVEEKAASKLGAESGFSFSANVALATEYRFRGVGLTDDDLAIQGGFDVSHSSGLYAGVWASNLDEDSVGFGSTELDIYGGWSGNLSDGFSADVGVIYYAFPNAPFSAGPTDYIEFYGSVTASLGPVSVTPGIAYAPDQDSLGSTDNLYLYTDLSIGVPETPITLNGHLGYTDGFLTFTPDSEAFDWSISADLAVNSTFTVSAAYIGVEGTAISDAADFTDDAFVITVSASF